MLAAVRRGKLVIWSIDSSDRQARGLRVLG